MVRLALLLSLFAVSVLPQAGSLGAFTHSDDVGGPPLKGSAVYDAAKREYRITGTGTDIWGASDQFHYVWREMSGNFVVTAAARILTDGNAHRKASIMLRKTLDADSPFLHLAIHGDGMPSLQFRSAKADITNTLDFPIQGPGTFTLRLAREGSTVTVSMAKGGAPLEVLGSTFNQLGSPVLVGLAVASHSQGALTTALFSDVSIEETPAQPAAR